MFLLFLTTVQLNARIPQKLASWTLSYVPLTRSRPRVRNLVLNHRLVPSRPNTCTLETCILSPEIL